MGSRNKHGPGIDFKRDRQDDVEEAEQTGGREYHLPLSMKSRLYSLQAVVVAMIVLTTNVGLLHVATTGPVVPIYGSGFEGLISLSSGFDEEACALWLLQIQDDSGGFPDTVLGEPRPELLDILRGYWAIQSLQALGCLEALDKELTIGYIASLQTEDGHFKRNEIEEAQGPGNDVLMTSAAVLSLQALEGLGSIDVEGASRWLLDAQTSERMDLHQWWMMSEALDALGESGEINATALLNRVTELVEPTGGLGSPGEYPYYHRLSFTYWGLRALRDHGLLGELSGEFLNQTGRWVASLQTEDGSFTSGEGSAPLQDLFNALGILDVLGMLNLVDLDGARDYAEGCQLTPEHVEGRETQWNQVVGGVGDRYLGEFHGFPIMEPANTYWCTQILQTVKEHSS